MIDVLASLTDQFGPVLLGVACALAFAESALGIGSLIPGEATILALSTAIDEPVEGVSLLLAVVVGAVAGDHAGYALGRWQGDRIRSSRAMVRLGVQHWDRATVMVRRHGCVAVVTSRAVPVVRTLMPAVAGASGLSYRRFALGSVAGSLIWAGVWVGAGVLGGSVVVQVVQRAGIATLVLIVGVVVALLLIARRRRVARAIR